MSTGTCLFSRVEVNLMPNCGYMLCIPPVVRRTKGSANSLTVPTECSAVIYYWPAYTQCSGQTSNGRWHLSSSVVVCNTRICNATHHGIARDGGPVVLRPVFKATPCFVTYFRKVMACRILIQNEQLEQVETFQYFGP